MLVEKITEEEIEFMELFYNPIALAECSFSDFDNLLLFEEQRADLRIYQFPMMSYEYMIDTDRKDLSKKENFRLKEGAGTVYAFGSRRHGKTLIVEQIDILLSFCLLEGEHVGFSSIDAIHIRGIIEKIITVLKVHKFYSLLEAQINRSPNYRISLTSGYLFESINMNIAGQTPGLGFMQKHLHRLYVEEASYETHEVLSKRIDAVSEEGCVYRFAGMTNFTRYSPAGMIFFDGSKRKQLVNLPQYINEKWDDLERQKMIKEYGGEGSIPYRVFVKGEVTDEGISVFDMDRVKKQYLYDKQVKSFEVNKDNFSYFKELIIVERPVNANRVFVCGDIGETAPTEIVVIYEVDGKLYYTYEIVAYRLDDKQQYLLFSYLIDCLKAEVCSLDSTDGTGRSILRQLVERYNSEQVFGCSFNEKIGIDFERDSNNRIVFECGKPKLKNEYVSEWSIRMLKTLFYEGKLFVPYEGKLDTQLNSVIASNGGLRVAYSVVCEEDHLLSAFRVFGIAYFICEFKNFKPLGNKKFSKIGV